MRHKDASSGDEGQRFDRRRFLAGTAVLVVGGLATGTRAHSALAAPRMPDVALGSQPHGLPVRQHAWGAFLNKDKFGNSLAPRFDRLLFFDVRGRPTAAHVRLLESRLRTLERHFHWSPGGLLFTVSWGPEYFTNVLHKKSPISKAEKRSSFESPEIDRYHMCIHMACDDQQRLIEITQGLIHNHSVPGITGSLSLHPAFVWRETRTGFVGAGLPAANQNVKGIPAGNPVPRTSPLFMGFKSGLVKNQASEDRVTIDGGAFAQGTTMQVSYMRDTLHDWYASLSEQDRIARMYSPQTTAATVAKLTTDAPSNHSAEGILNAARKYGVVGHSQMTATAREKGRPLIIRRDFNTTDGGYAGLHFVSVQQSIQDFVVTRNAMNGSDAHALNKKITATTNNGINAFIEVRKRANYIMPSRADRSFPLWDGRKEALG